MEELVPKKMMINCKDASFLSILSEQTKLSLWQRIQLNFHLLLCKVCRLFSIQSKKMNDLLQMAHEHEIKHHLSESKKEEINHELSQLIQ